ncbi:aldolase [Pseudonocardia eucalypti]|uniref:Aldolase n=1 Tax=Pseudonocardia eucalypti TaxID=648755 RepID=A0ABP9R177_9PSEU|nr:tagatose 1,6-diphosphate aldolase/sulfofructosephosphate aldolase [Pseudonocardia eucalypti]
MTTESATTGLDRIAGPDGVFAIVAMDQRNTLRRMFAAVEREATEEALGAVKADVIRALSPAASAVLLDPDIGVPAVRGAGALAGGTGLLIAAEPSSRGNHNGEPRAFRLPERDAAWVRDLGGHAVKFLVQLRPDRPKVAGEPDLVAEVLEVVERVVEDCRKVGLPSVVENVVYQLPGEDELTPAAKEDAIVESARLLDGIGPDLLKLEYPGSPAGCRRIAEAVRRPWAVLSAGVPFEEFSRVLRVSCDEGGAAGFIAGRALWKEAVGLDGPARAEFLDGTARRRLDDCLAAVSGRATPWTKAR